MTSKVCLGCGVDQLFENFHRSNKNNRKDGRKTRCKTCHKASTKLYNDTHRESVRINEQARSRTPHHKYRKLIASAKRRGLEFNLPEQVYTALILLPCNYCGGKLPEVGAGLDRINSKTGYVLGNVLPCCWTCNTMKMSMDVDHFYAHMQLILSRRPK